MSTQRLSRPIVVLVVVMAVLAGTLGTVTGLRAFFAAHEPGPLVGPDSGAWLGAWVSSREGYSTAKRQAAILDLEASVGRKLAIDHDYVGWGDPLGWQPAWDLRNGRMPLISFGSQGDVREVAQGRHDVYLRGLAAQVRALGKPVFLRYAYEMDGVSNVGWVHSGRDYVAAWRHVHRLFDGLPVTWVWSPNARAFGDPSRDVAQYWPGDDYVDWIAADGYNWYGCRGRKDWKEFGDIFRAFYHWGSARQKPLMIAEAGSTEDPADPGRKAAWLDRARAALKDMPDVKAVVWFDSAKDCGTWWLDSTSHAFAAFQRFARDAWLTPPTLSERRRLPSRPRRLGRMGSPVRFAGGSPPVYFAPRESGAAATVERLQPGERWRECGARRTSL